LKVEGSLKRVVGENVANKGSEQRRDPFYDFSKTLEESRGGCRK